MLKQDVKTLERAEGIRHARRRREGERPDDAGERVRGRDRAHGTGRRVGHASRQAGSRTARVRVVLAHEFGHIAHRHLWKGLAWAALFTFPDRVRGGAHHAPGGAGSATRACSPTARSSSLLLNVAITPLTNVVSRRYEGEADWSALQAARGIHRPRRSSSSSSRATSLEQPDPPTWSYLFFDTHPTLMQRIAMAEAWREQHGSVPLSPGPVPRNGPYEGLSLARECHEGLSLALSVAAVARFGRLRMFSRLRPLRVRVVHRVQQLVHEPRRHVHAARRPLPARRLPRPRGRCARTSSVNS